MTNQDIFSIISELQNDIFNSQFRNFPNKFGAFAESLAVIFHSSPTSHSKAFNRILLALIHAYENKDYLLVADTLEFELKPLLIEVLGGEE